MANPEDFANTPPDQPNAYGPFAQEANTMLPPQRPANTPDDVVSTRSRLEGDAMYRYTGRGLRGEPIPLGGPINSRPLPGADRT